MPGWGRAVSRASPILSNPAPSWSVSITVGRRLGKLLGRADRFSPGDSVQAPSTSPRQFNLIDRTLNHVTLVLKINGVAQTTENQAGGGLFFFFSLLVSLLILQRLSEPELRVTQKMSL